MRRWRCSPQEPDHEGEHHSPERADVRAVLGLDIGTTSVKAVALSSAGDVIATSSSGPMSLSAPESGWAVQSTLELDEAVVDCLAQLSPRLPRGTECVAMSAAVQSGSLVLVDPGGEPLLHMTTWMDTRTNDIVERWNEDGTAALIRRISGWSAQPGLGLAQLVWLRENDPSVWSGIGRVGSADDFATSRLTGHWVTNTSNAAGMQLIDIETGQWSEELCELAGVSAAQLSDLKPSGSIIGSLAAEVAATTGLPIDLPVVNGGHDQTCTALALGVAEPGRALLAVGTAWVLTTVVDAADPEPVPREMNVSFHVVDGLRTTSRYLGGLGASMEWWLSEAGFGAGEGAETARYTTLDTELAAVEITLDSPYFLRTSDTGGIVERPGAGRFWPPGSTTHRAACAMAIMEFAAFEVRAALEALPARHRPIALTAVGGATNSPRWARIISDVCAVPVRVVPAHSYPAVGAAMLAGRTAAGFDDLLSTNTDTRSRGEILTPSPTSISLYDHRYRNHLELSQENR